MRVVLFIAVYLVSNIIKGQELEGEWYGNLDLNGTELRLDFKISSINDHFTSKMDSPDQGAFGLKVDETIIRGDTIVLKLVNLGITYSGIYKDRIIKGLFAQAGMQFPLTLMRNVAGKKVKNRPQEPFPPYPYETEEIEIQSDFNTIAGTLTVPTGSPPVALVIFISGSGPQNRDEEWMGHKPFLVWADHLTKNEIAVFRYDDRGIGKSTGNFLTSTSNDFAKDVKNILQHFRDIPSFQNVPIGLVGHSEGALVAPIVIANDKKVDFLIMLAGPGLKGDKILLQQIEMLGEGNGMTPNEIAKEIKMSKQIFRTARKAKTVEGRENDLIKFLEKELNEKPESIPSNLDKDSFIRAQVQQLMRPWWYFFINHDPKKYLAKVKCPLLAVNGTKDRQISAKSNLAAIDKCLKKSQNKNYSIRQFPNLNHLFQESNSGNIEEYSKIEQTVSPAVLDLVTSWILTNGIVSK